MPAVKPIYFGPFVVTSQVFYQTKHSLALVNLKPLLPGHTLVCPKRVVPRIKELSTEEITDLFLTVQKVSKVLETIFRSEGFNIAIQDGAAAGQSVPHVHAHIIPRHNKDLPNSDDIYTLIESDAGDLGKIFREHEQKQEPLHASSGSLSTPHAVSNAVDKELVLGNAGTVAAIANQESLISSTITSGPSERPKFPVPPPDHLRKPRTTQQMEAEAKLLGKFMEEADAGGF